MEAIKYHKMSTSVHKQGNGKIMLTYNWCDVVPFQMKLPLRFCLIASQSVYNIYFVGFVLGETLLSVPMCVMEDFVQLTFSLSVGHFVES